MKQIKFIVLLITGLFLFACTSDERTESPSFGDGSLLRVAIKNTGKAATYAPGEYEAYPQEKEIRSVAFFTLTDDVGRFGDPGFAPGAFNKYFSTEELRSVHGLYEPLENVGGNYKVGIRIKSEGFGTNTQVIVIANYDENGLTQTLMDVKGWEELKSVLTPDIQGEHLHTPLVMYGAASIALANGATEQADIRLSRIVARLDVVNEAAVPAEPEKGFVLESVELLHPKKFGFLLPGNKVSRQIPTEASLPVITAGNLPENDSTKITGLYLYETDNSGDESPKTSVRLKGQLFGSPFERVIPLKKPDEVGTEGDPIGLERNHRYQLTITKLTGADIEWTIQVADWTDGPDVPVRPTLSKPELSAFSFDNGGDVTRWDETTRTYTYDGTQPEVIRFTATGTHATTYDFHCELDGKGESIGMNNPDYENRKRFVKRAEPVFSYSTVSQEYEIMLPTVLKPDEYAVPVDVKLYIQNQANYYHADTITIRCRPSYPETLHQPVLLGGLYWAPVNVGATEIDNTNPSLATRGHFFQWGRNEPISYIYDFSKTVTGPVSYEDAIGQYKGWFITSSNDWLKSDDRNIDYRNIRWSKDVNDSPCPKGWRLPEKSEASHVYNKAPSHDGTKKRLYLTGDESGIMLYFPLTDYRNATNVSGMANYQYLAMIHTSTKTSATTFSRWCRFYDSSYGWQNDQYNTEAFATACSVRCVQAVTPTVK